MRNTINILGNSWLLAILSVLLVMAFPLKAEEAQDVALAPHKALYDIKLVASRGGSQVVNISGQMFYQMEKTCDAWITDHRFNLAYEYTDSPQLRITSDFSTYESTDGQSFSFSSRRKRDGNLYQEFRGQAKIDPEKTGDKAGQVEYSIPSYLSFDLKEGSYFPIGHTKALIEKAKAGTPFFNARVFDGSDEEGPIDINSFIAEEINALASINPSANLDTNLMNTKAWKIRMAVFPVFGNEEQSDYEMTMVFHDNGVISEMLIDYDDFSITQNLVALEKLEPKACGS